MGFWEEEILEHLIAQMTSLAQSTQPPPHHFIHDDVPLDS